MTMMTRWFTSVLAFAGMLSIVHADGGAVISSEVVGSHRVTVISDPAVLRAGPVDFSVLVQDARTDEPVPDASVAFTLAETGRTDAAESAEAWVSPCCVVPSFNRDRIPATHEAAQNKLLQAATVILPTAGDYELTTYVASQLGQATVLAPITALAPASPLATFWPALALPGAAIGLFALRERISR